MDCLYEDALCCAVRCQCSRSEGPNAQAECEERIAIVDVLLSRNAVKDLHWQYQTILVEACYSNCVDISRMLIKRGADLNGASQLSQRPGLPGQPPYIAYAASHGHWKLMEDLLQSGAEQISLFQMAIFSIRFHKKAADLGMMTYLRERNAVFYQNGPFEQEKAEFIFQQAKKHRCERVMNFLIARGFEP